MYYFIFLGYYFFGLCFFIYHEKKNKKIHIESFNVDSILMENLIDETLNENYNGDYKENYNEDYNENYNIE